MSKSLSKHLSPVVLAVMFGAALLLGGCAEKAKTLQIGAAQFESESLAAIDRIDELRRLETAVAPRPEADLVQLFHNLVLNSTGTIGPKELASLSDPLRQRRVANDDAWQRYLGELRNQYVTFRSVFASLDKGSLLAAPNVEETAQILGKLIAQLVAFADSTKQTGARFTRERAALAAEIMSIRDNAALPKEAKQSMLSVARGRLLDVVAAEEEASRAVIEQCLKAAIVGRELRDLIAAYGRVSVDDIAEGLSKTISVAAQLTGRDLSSLSTRSDSIIKEIKTDPQLAAFFDEALNDLQGARNSP